MSDERLERVEIAIEKLAENQQKLIRDLERYKGIWGGIMLTCSAIWAFVLGMVKLNGS